MQNTTDDVRRCKFCNKPLDFKEVEPFIDNMKPMRFYLDCECPDAVKARDEEQRIQEAKQREADKRDFYERLKRAGVKERYKHATHELANELTSKVLGGTSLYICGAFGTGKTYIASAIVRRLVWEGKRVRILTGIDLTMELQATYGSSDSEADVMEKFGMCPILVIDDLGKEPPSDWVLSRLFALINARYDELLPTIITTNYERSKLIERMGNRGDHDVAEAMVSRLYEMGEVVKITGEDRRLQ